MRGIKAPFALPESLFDSFWARVFCSVNVCCQRLKCLFGHRGSLPVFLFLTGNRFAVFPQHEKLQHVLDRGINLEREKWIQQCSREGGGGFIAGFSFIYVRPSVVVWA